MELTDKQIFEGIKSGNESDFECCFRRYYPRLVNYAVRFTVFREIAYDIVQDCFTRLWERRTILHKTDLASLLFTMVRNSCLDYLKHNAVVSRYELEYKTRIQGEEKLYCYDFLYDAEQPYLYEELQSEIQTAIDSLSDRCREIFLMSRFENLKNREIAGQLGISEKTVEKHLSRAVKQLSFYLKKHCSFELAIVIQAGLFVNNLMN